MAEIAVGLARSVVEGTLSKAREAIQEEAKLWQSAQRNLVFITGEFEMMRSFLDVANAERVENPVFRTWVRQIRELAFDVEDCIELVVHLDKKRTSFWFRVRRGCLPWAPSRVPALDEAVDEIEQLKDRVADVSTRNVRYSLISDTGSKPVVQQELPAPFGGGTVAAANMLAEARRAQVLGGGDLTQLITKEFADDPDVQVISVWGSGSDHGTASIIMKTYGHTEIRKTFTHRAWVKLHHPFSPRDCIGSLMAQFCAAHSSWVDAPIGMEVFNNFQDLVTRAKYLVVVEGLSNMADWHALRTFLPNGMKGSKIIVSTQQPEIATLCIDDSYQILELKEFSAEHSVCALFSKDSHGETKTRQQPMVEDSAEHVLGREGYRSQRGKGKNAMVEDSPHNKDLPRIVGSHGDRGEVNKPIHLVSPLEGRVSETKELSQYPAKALMNQNWHVMSVWGIAGVGKSALVKELFENPRIKKNEFDKYYWVDVSHPLNLRDFHRSIPSEFRNEKQSWLIVIDDIQSKLEWDLMQRSLVPGSSRSVIIAITTDASIAAYCSNGEDLLFNVKGLEEVAATCLFRKVCRTHQNISDDNFKTSEVKELILKCGGLPKVIVAIAGVLAKETVKWMDTVVSLNQRFMHDLQTKPRYDSLRDLFGWMDSYFRNCTDSLKPCIFYLSIFPRDHHIRRRRLVRRFIAEGYSRDDTEESAEKIGEKQFAELLDLSIIHQVPHLFTNSLNKRMVLCQVNGFIHEYIIPRRKEENLMFELGGNSSLTTNRTGRHLIISKHWNRDMIVFKSMDFSRLRSLTVFGSWVKFLISENMKLLRVLDLEDAEGLEYDDLENIVKWLHRLKFLSLRGQREIHHLPDDMDNLRQLETLDVRGTSIVTLPQNITKLQKLQYIRAGNRDMSKSTSPSETRWLPEFCKCRHLVGVRVPTGLGKLTALHTLGVVNVAASRRKALEKALKKLTQLRKLGVSGINRKNIKDFSSAIKDHPNMESLSVHLDKDHQCCLDAIDLPLGKLRSFKLYGLNKSLPRGSQQLIMLTKLNLVMHTLTESDITLLAMLPELFILRLRIEQTSIHFIATVEGEEQSSFKKVKILEISCSYSPLPVKFGLHTLKTLELLKLDSSSGTSYEFTDSMDFISKLKEFVFIGSAQFQADLAEKIHIYQLSQKKAD